MAEMAFIYDEAQTLAENAFTRPYYDFNGWAIQSAGEAQFADGVKKLALGFATLKKL